MIRVLCRGDLDWTLGMEYLLLAMRCLLDDEVAAELTIAGDGPERDRVLFTIEDLELRGAVRVLPAAFDRNRLFAEADVFLLVPLDDAPRPDVYSALRSGLPVVWGGRADAPIEHDLSGLRVQPRDPRAIADALSRLGSDAALRERLIA